jgi:hypothetical protein
MRSPIRALVICSVSLNPFQREAGGFPLQNLETASDALALQPVELFEKTLGVFVIFCSNCSSFASISVFRGQIVLKARRRATRLQHKRRPPRRMPYNKCASKRQAPSMTIMFVFAVRWRILRGSRYSSLLSHSLARCIDSN